MTQLGLMFALPGGREHDLPPKWDGHAVEWRGWEAGIPMFICPPAQKECCERCGSQAEASYNAGIIHPIKGETVVPIKGAAWPYLDLWASRCPDCRRDTVRRMSTDEVWLLDEGDYGPDGSNEELEGES